MKLSVEIPEKIYSRGFACEHVPPNPDVLIFSDETGVIYTCPEPGSPVDKSQAKSEIEIIKKVLVADVVDGAGWNVNIVNRLEQRMNELKDTF